MSENQQIMDMLKQVIKQNEEIKKEIRNKNTDPAILTVKTFTERYGSSPSTQQKLRTDKTLPENIPYSKIGGITYITKETDAYMQRHGLNKP